MKTYFGLLAILFLVGGAWLLVRRLAVAWRGVPAVGQVVAFEERRAEQQVHYLPVVSFRDQRGLAHCFTSPAGSADREPAIGSIVPVRYLPDAPEQVFIVSSLHMWAAPAGFFVLGLGSLLAWIKA
ncbi:DUF3592 domain-containing protein [Ramlibacter sp. USB13]|uniref:DUF3592 domain-containing protein n=1 Tax=Ramlibacter cellulosilyticus TaxID=2764187 RepID=A0A923MRA6_9BURK|nr:DUF3592 domain-containing protein [Ramlibacter cellulosilyticus]MBC5783149.1 DUF3592 domain-containing protein [Ramlibacter cellulosilyticus]